MKNKSLILGLISIFILLIIFLIPYYNLFSFEKKDKIEDKQEVKKLESIDLTNFNLEELEKINSFFETIDDKKIIDDDLKGEIYKLKTTFLKEKEKKVLRNYLEKQKEKKKIKEVIFPKELDITSKFSKLHIQERNLSCEASATTDILSTILGKDIVEVDILKKMKKDKTYGKKSYYNNGKLIWGDPDNGFVGEMDGHQFNLTGYAIYEKPMSEIYKQYGVKFETYNKFENNLGLKSPKEALVYLLKELNKGNFVQIRGDYCTDQEFEDGNIDRKISTQEALDGLSQKNYCYSFFQERKITWYTEEGKRIDAAKQSHNFLILGYKGGIENPSHIIVWDTQTGRHIYPTSEWMRKWDLNDARAIIVYSENNK